MLIYFDTSFGHNFIIHRSVASCLRLVTVTLIHTSVSTYEKLAMLMNIKRRKCAFLCFHVSVTLCGFWQSSHGIKVKRTYIIRMVSAHTWLHCIYNLQFSIQLNAIALHHFQPNGDNTMQFFPFRFTLQIFRFLF